MTRSSSRLAEIAASSAKVGVATVAGLAGWIVGGKILALEVGAAGVGTFGLLRQLLQTCNVYATVNGANALVQGIASRTDESRAQYVSSVAGVYAVGGFLVSGTLLVGSWWLGPLLIPHPQAVPLVRWLALAVFATSAQSYYTGLLNGYRAVNALVRAQLLGPLMVMIAAYPTVLLVRRGQSAAYTVMLAAPAAAVAAMALWETSRRGWSPSIRIWRIHWASAIAFLRTSAVLLVSGLLVTGTQYLLNRLVVERLGLVQSGHFWVAWTLSMTYVTVLLGSYGTYYMPALSALKGAIARRELIRDYLRLALCVMPVLVSTVILVKPWIVVALFSSQLLPALSVMRWMLLGDYFKGIAWVLAFPMLALNQMRWFFWTELAFHAAMLLGASLWLSMGGSIEGIGVVFAGLYAAYVPLMYWYVVREHGFRAGVAEVALFVVGVLMVGAMSAVTWPDTTVRAWSCALLAVTAAMLLATARRLLLRRNRPEEATPVELYRADS